EAFRYKDGRWQYNTPNCTDAMKSAQVCGIRVRVLANSYYKDGQTQYLNTESNAVIYDACPRNHWNNAIKQSPMHPDYAGIGNPCGADKKDHVDLYGALWYRLGFPKDLNSAHLTVSIKAEQNQNTPSHMYMQTNVHLPMNQSKFDSGICPDGSNGPAKGFGTIYQCGQDICAKSDKDGTYPCTISKGSSQQSQGNCPDGSNGPAKGFGTIYQCGRDTCAKSDKDGLYPCIISQGWQGHSACPDGSNGPGKGYGLIYTCGDKMCAKSDLDYLNECAIGD
ncbi:MAG: hypothetical protein NTX25_10615, partial [Proteobacteria bacterium]|nr:hypothetical protein [Pseudomonadota bacterium]